MPTEMLYCEPCREENRLPGSLSCSNAECEFCGRRTLCHNLSTKEAAHFREIADEHRERVRATLSIVSK